MRDNEFHAHPLSKLLFSWVSALFSVDAADISHRASFALPPSFQTSQAKDLLVNFSTSDRLVRIILGAYYRPIIVQGALMLVATLAGIAGSYALKEVVEIIGSPSPLTTGPILLLTSLLLVSALAEQHALHICFKLCAPLRTGILYGLVSKVFRVSPSCISEKSGSLHNLVHKDSMMLANVFADTAIYAITPLRIIAIVFALYHLLGQSALVGIAVLVLLLAAFTSISRRIGSMTRRRTQKADSRLHITKVALDHMEQLKVDGMEESVRAEIEGLRQEEVEEIARYTWWSTNLSLLALVSTILVAMSAIATYIYIHGKISTGTALTGISLLAMLRTPIMALPSLLARFQEARIANERIEGFLREPEAEFTPKEQKPSLRDGALLLGDIEIDPGELVAIIGSTGSGKSALLREIAGQSEFWPSGTFQPNGSIAYVDQESWLFTGSVKDNIVFDQDFSEDKLARVLRICGLEEDVAAWPFGIDFQVGDGGASVSGGQRMRIALARTMYCDTSIVLLDNPLAPLDPLVAEHVMMSAIVPDKATRIVVLTDTKWLPYMDRVIEVKDRQFREVGMPSRRQTLERKIPKMDCHAPENENSPVVKLPDVRDRTELDSGRRVTGGVSSSAVSLFINHTGGFLPLILLGVLFVITESLKSGTEAFLSFWASGGGLPASAFLLRYGLMACAAIGIAAAGWLLSAKLSIRLGTQAHSVAIAKILSAPLGFHNRWARGEILNRLNSDLNELELRTMGHVSSFLAISSSIVIMLVLAVVTQPYILPIIGVVAVSYYWVQGRFRAYSREVKRVNAADRTPVYGIANDILSGAFVLKVNRSMEFCKGLFLRRFLREQRSFYTLMALNRWLAIRLELLAVLIVAALALASGPMAIPTDGLSSIMPSLLALSLTYAFMSSTQFNAGVRRLAMLESSFTAVERLAPFWQLPDVGGNDFARFAKPTPIKIVNGCLSFDGKTHVLSHIDLTLEPGTTLGICGRTGSGKSTLLKVLLGLYPLTDGQFTIGGQRLRPDGLALWTRHVAALGQQHHFKFGSIQSALSGMHTSDPDRCVAALKKVGLIESFVRNSLSMTDPVSKWDMSPGERQLFGLARISMSCQWFVGMDEPTSSLGRESRQKLFEVLRSIDPTKSTVVVSHDIETLGLLDRVIVLDDGRIVEVGRPVELMRDKKSKMYQMFG